MATPREKVIQQAERYVARGKVEAAIREYRKVLAENPRDTNTLNRVGDLYARLERNGEAIQLFIKIAETYTDDGFFVKAIAIYKKIIKLDPTRLDIYEKLAELYHRQGLVNEARTQYQVLADYYQKHDQIEAATGICRRMVLLEPANPSHRAKLADLLEQQGKGAEAIEQYSAIGDQMIATGQPDGAVRVYEKALDVEADTLEFLHAALTKLRDAGQTEAAERLRGQALRRKPQLEGELERLERNQPARTGSSPSGSRKELKLIQPKPFVFPPAAPPEPLLSSPPRSSSSPAAIPSVLVSQPPQADPDEFELFLDEVAEAPPARPVTKTPPLGQSADALPAIDFDLSLDDEVFVFDLEDDSPAASQVSPPPDMAGRPPRSPSEIPPSGVGELPPPTSLSELDGGIDPAAIASQGMFSEFDFGPGSGSAEDTFDAAGGLDLDSDFLERTAAEVQPGHSRQEEDLFTEAEVLAKYGLREKALERLEELFRVNPNHLGAYALQIGLYLELGRHERVVILANEMSGIGSELNQTDLWDEVRERLQATGYVLEGLSRVVAAPTGVRLPITQPTAEQLFDGFDEEPEVAPVPALTAPLEPVLPPPDLPSTPTTSAPTTSGFLADVDLEVEESLGFREELPTLDLPPLDAVPPAIRPRLEPELEELLSDLPASEDPLIVAEPAESELFEVKPPAPVVPPAAEPPARKRKSAQSDVDAAFAQIAGTLGKTKSPTTPASFEVRPPRAAPAQVQPPPVAMAPAVAPPSPAVESGMADLFDLRSIGADIEAEASLAGLSAPRQPSAVWPKAEPPRPLAPSLPAERSELSDLQIFMPDAEFAPADTDVSWLDEVTAEAAPKAGGEAQLFADEEGFFDLAAELEEELRNEDTGGVDSFFSQPHEQSLEEIVEGFKRGVAEHLSPEDYETHFNLGIAYREMGLLDEAIGEFQLAAKNPARLVDCCSMLGLSFLDKSLPELAVKWYRRGLAHPGLPEIEQLGLLYELGSAYLAMGDRDNARKTYVEIYGINTNYRDVVARLSELGH